MKTSKTISDIANIHSLRSIPRTRRSAKPQLPTTAVLNLYMARNERDRMVKERMRLTKRKAQLEGRLRELEQEMDLLLEQTYKKGNEIRDQAGSIVPAREEKEKGSSKRIVLEY